jgi:fumarylacetoacetate (FAA) hydrolase family protein
MELDPAVSLPVDHAAATLIGRAWLPGPIPGPAVIAVRGSEVYDITARVPTVSTLLEREDAAAVARSVPGRPIGSLAELLRNSAEERRDASRAFLLAPSDLQVIKAAGVTFASSLIERLIEEQARGNPAQAEAIRARIVAIVGEDLRSIVPGSDAALQLKASLVEQGLWSQYLEVGIGPDAEIFTKSPVLSAIGSGGDIGLHPASTWNNPEPEVVLAINSSGRAVGASLGNDVNLRDVEGRSALLLGRAKDNNGSCAIGPFLRLFDDGFGMEDVRTAEVTVRVSGPDGFTLEGRSSMRQISRDPLDLVASAIGRTHQYPDGLMLFLGTMFAPIEDRAEPGAGFTHKLGDIVTIATPRLGALVNRVGRSDQIAPWRFGIGALMRNLAQRGLLGASG